MLDFYDSTPEDFTGFGRRMWRAAQNSQTHEQTSQFIVRSLYEEFLTEAGEPKLALVRIYRLTKVEDLPVGVQRMVDKRERQVVALTGTYGMIDSWCDRTQSVNHQAIPLSAVAVPQQIPMFEEVLRQLGIDMEALYTEQELTGGTGMKGHFYIPQVPGNPLIPAQAEFVKPYGIQSLIAFGGFMSDGHESRSMYFLFAFSREAIPQSAVEQTAGLPEFIGGALAGQKSHISVFNQ
jgi:hypothetical protein